MNFLLGITPWPVLSALLWIVLAVSALYLARPTAHEAIRAAARALHRSFRLASAAIRVAERNLATRNREVLLAAGREAKERVVEREFERVSESVRRDLANYATLHRKLSDSIARIEDDHHAAVDVPPEPPGWVKAVEAVANIDAREGRVEVGNILGDIHKSLIKAHHEAMALYRKASSQRHALLHRMRPDWRRIQQSLDQVGKSVDSLLGRSVAIDRHMQEFEDIVSGKDSAVSILSSSSLVYFFVSALVLVVAIGGATINFSLIARPMAEMVGGTNLIGGFQTADIAALVIIMVEISMGLFLMESLRITRLFPVIGALPDKIRVRMIWITFTILFLLASVEAGLAYMREVLLQDELATSALLRGDGQAGVTTQFMWITTAAQMGMGFILPFALTFVAIPLETFVHSLRTIVGLGAIGLLRLLSLLMRLLGNVFRYMGSLLQQLYDLPLFIPLWLAQRNPGSPGPMSVGSARKVSS
ncbi:MAG: hypothetical protein U5K38_07635 [Woeseiaceae bacterium]|nr:hypothetical protein [Woeseiaceae bacterium]